MQPSYIRCTDKDFGTVSLFIRPCRTKRIELAEAAQNGTFESVRSQIKLSDYEFYYTARSQADFTNENIYKSIVGDIFAGQYVNPEDDDQSIKRSVGRTLTANNREFSSVQVATSVLVNEFSLIGPFLIV